MQYVIYVALILLGLAFPKKKSVAYGMLLFIWVLFVFNRGNADFAHYKEIYYDMATITTLVYRGVEAGWLTLCAISRDVFHLEYEVFIAIIGTVSLIFMVSTIKRYTEQMALVLALFMICPLLIDVVQIRFFFVTSVLFWGFRFVEKKSLKGDALFCALILVCSLIHSSALLLLLVIPMRYFGLTFQKILLAAWCVLGPLMIQPMCDLFARISGKYLHYTLTSTSWLTRGCSFVLFVGILLVTNLAYLAVKRSPSGDAGGYNFVKAKAIR